MEISGDLIKTGWINTVQAIADAIPGEDGITQMSYQAPAAAADVAALKTQFDALLAKLVASGLMASS